MPWRKLTSIVALLSIFMVMLLTARVSLADFGTNWTAQYYDNKDLSGDPVQTDNGINGINFNWGSGKPISKVDSDKFSIRYTSTQTFGQGTYEFILSSDDGARVFIDGNLVLDRFVSRPLTTDRFQQTLSAGDHSLKVEYFENTDNASIQFQWFLVSAAVASPANIYTPGFVLPTGIPATAFPTTIPATSLPSIPPGALTAVVIKAANVKIHIAPNLTSQQIGKVQRGQTYAILGRDADARWFLMQFSGFQGWVWGYYLFVNGNEFNPPVVSSFVLQGNPADVSPSGTVVQARVTFKLRAAPSQDSEQIGRVTLGDMLPVIGRTRGGVWFKVVYKGTTGWIGAFGDDWIKVFEGSIDDVPFVDG